MNDKIFIDDLRVRCIIGVNPSERDECQDVLVSLVVEGDWHAAALADDIGQALDYRTLQATVLEIAEVGRFRLIETLAERIAARCLQQRSVRRVTVRVAKPGALRFARSVAFEIVRSVANGA